MKKIIKDLLKKSFFYPLFERIRAEYLYIKRKVYIDELREYIHDDTTVISSNCFAGRIMQDLKIKYNSPTLGLYFFAPEYNKFLKDIKYYLTEAKLEFVEESKYELGNKRRAEWSHWYPIGNLGGVEIEFLHYYSEREAAEKWYRRSSRVNWNDLIIIGMEQNLCTSNHIKEFDKLPFEKKLFFSTRDILVPSNCRIEEFPKDTEVGDPYKKGHIFYKYLVKFLKNEK